jgi:glutamate/tyrosine decarboxylase-like PLP-dependent enzyme
MHHFTADSEALARAVFGYALERVRSEPPLDHPRSAAELAAMVGETITEGGLGWEEALRRWTEVLGPACLSIDFPRFLAFVPAAPTEAAALFDLIVSATSVYGGSWLEGAGAIFAENQALAWLADLAGLPAGSGGVFVSGGTNGNLSALVAARHTARVARGRPEGGWVVVAADSVHSSVVSAAAVMDVEVAVVPVDGRGRLTGAALAPILDTHGPRVFAVVASGGTTNLGIVDDLRTVGALCRSRGVWFHVDGAYGGAALVSERARPRFDGIEQADSFVVDPHKWLFAPFDCCALLYRDPALARAAHTQTAGYLDVLTESDDWNASDYAIHLTRRARGLPLWFSLATHGTAAYRQAVDVTLELAEAAARSIEAADHVELAHEPGLSVVVFRRLGWSGADYRAWSDRVLAEGLAFVVPTVHAGETLLRFCFVNPRTTIADVELILASLREPPT